MKTGKLDSTINKTWKVAYDSGELAAATSSITINGLDGNSDEEYNLIYRLVNGYAGGLEVTIRPNNDSGSSYGNQLLYGVNTNNYATRQTNTSINESIDGASQITFGTFKIQAKSGQQRTFIGKCARGVATTTVLVVMLRGDTWTNTADNLTSLVIAANQANGLGIGSRIILLKKVKLTTGLKTGNLNIQGSIKGTWERIYQNTLGAPATSLTISGLTGNSDALYRIRGRIVSGASSNDLKLTFNSDTGSNYGRQKIAGANTTASAERIALTAIYLNQASGLASGDLLRFEKILYAKSGYVRTAIEESSEAIATTNVNAITLTGLSWNNTTDEIIQMVLTATQTNGLGIGTEIIIERLNL